MPIIFTFLDTNETQSPDILIPSVSSDMQSLSLSENSYGYGSGNLVRTIKTDIGMLLIIFVYIKLVHHQ